MNTSGVKPFSASWWRVALTALSISKSWRHWAKQSPHVLQVYSTSTSFLDGDNCPSAKAFISRVLPFEDQVSVWLKDGATAVA